jgi:hypothetical protein
MHLKREILTWGRMSMHKYWFWRPKGRQLSNTKHSFLICKWQASKLFKLSLIWSPKLCQAIWSFSLNKISLFKIAYFNTQCPVLINIAHIKWEYLSKFNFNALFLFLKFYKNLGISLSGHCEWSPRYLCCEVNTVLTI